MFKARAKAELREEATSKDAMDVVEIMKYCLIDVFADISAEDTTIKSNLKSTSRNQVFHKITFVSYVLTI